MVLAGILAGSVERDSDGLLARQMSLAGFEFDVLTDSGFDAAGSSPMVKRHGN